MLSFIEGVAHNLLTLKLNLIWNFIDMDEWYSNANCIQRARDGMQRADPIRKTKRENRNMAQVMQNLTIKQVSQITETPPHTLRFWEKKFQDILVPSRINGDQRRYNEKDISVIKTIKLLKEQGINLSRIKEKLGNRENHSDIDRIDLLAQRLGELVRHEVYDFLKGEDR